MKKVFLALFFIALLVGGIFGYTIYNKNFTGNVAKEGYFFIPEKGNFQQILDSISPYLKDKEAFREVALSKSMDKYHHIGRYKVKEGMNNTDLVNMIKAGNQSDYPFRIGDFYDVYQMVGKVTKKTQIDSANFIKELEEIAHKKGYQNAEELKKYFFIDTYNFFWTVTPSQFFNKFEEQYNEFWTAERQQKEKKLGLTRDQIYALASIVYKESGGKVDEQKTIAGLYLNRYKKGMKLQSDPTVIYAVNKANNFTTKIRRVLYKDLRTPSPYNTYANAGIPPGPICIVDKNSVDAVLNAENNNYIFMCADPNRLGYHKFTDNDAEHAKNAKEYQDWLNKKNIKK